LGGLALSKAYGSREFQAGGCAINTKLVPLQDAFVLEFFFTLSLILLAFGVGLDPRQTNVISPTFAPWLVGITLGILGVASAYTRVGYSGASQSSRRTSESVTCRANKPITSSRHEPHPLLRRLYGLIVSVISLDTLGKQVSTTKTCFLCLICADRLDHFLQP